MQLIMILATEEAQVGIKKTLLFQILIRVNFTNYILKDLRAESKSLFSAAGKIISVSPIFPENQLRGYCILKGEKSSLKLSFTLTPEVPARIQEYDLTEWKDTK